VIVCREGYLQRFPFYIFCCGRRPCAYASLAHRKRQELPPIAVSGPDLSANLTVILSWHGPVPQSYLSPSGPAQPAEPPVTDVDELPGEAAQIAARDASMLGTDVVGGTS
jgi:hypothetical protein